MSKYNFLFNVAGTLPAIINSFNNEGGGVQLFRNTTITIII